MNEVNTGSPETRTPLAKSADDEPVFAGDSIWSVSLRSGLIARKVVRLYVSVNDFTRDMLFECVPLEDEALCVDQAVAFVSLRSATEALIALHERAALTATKSAARHRRKIDELRAELNGRAEA